MRKAGELGDAALRAGIEATQAGADEGDILAAQQAAIFAGGGDYPANEFIIGSGRDALLCRYKSGRRKLSASDQLTLELAGRLPPLSCRADAHDDDRQAEPVAMARCMRPRGRRLAPARR